MAKVTRAAEASENTGAGGGRGEGRELQEFSWLGAKL